MLKYTDITKILKDCRDQNYDLRPSMSPSSSLLYISLAGSDILLCFLCIITMGRASSVLTSFLTSLFSLTSLASVAAIPADKAISLGCPFQYHNIVTRSEDNLINLFHFYNVGKLYQFIQSWLVDFSCLELTIK